MIQIDKKTIDDKIIEHAFNEGELWMDFHLDESVLPPLAALADYHCRTYGVDSQGVTQTYGSLEVTSTSSEDAGPSRVTIRKPRDEQRNIEVETEYAFEVTGSKVKLSDIRRRSDTEKNGQWIASIAWYDSEGTYRRCTTYVNNRRASHLLVLTDEDGNNHSIHAVRGDGVREVELDGYRFAQGEIYFDGRKRGLRGPTGQERDIMAAVRKSEGRATLFSEPREIAYTPLD